MLLVKSVPRKSIDVEASKRLCPLLGLSVELHVTYEEPERLAARPSVILEGMPLVDGTLCVIFEICLLLVEPLLLIFEEVGRLV